MAVLTIPEELLEETGLSEREMLVELACCLFDAGRLSFWSAAKLAGLDRIEFEEALMQRGIPIYRVDAKYWAQELAALEQLDRLEK